MDTMTMGRKGFFLASVFIMKRSQDRNLRQELIQKPWMNVILWLVLHSFPSLFLLQLRAASPGVGLARPSHTHH